MSFVSNNYLLVSGKTNFNLKETKYCKVTRFAVFFLNSKSYTAAFFRFNRFQMYERGREALLAITQCKAPLFKKEEHAEMLFRLAKTCLNKLPRFSIQQFFAKLIRFYIANCPHITYVTEASLEQSDSIYHADQLFYAEWCHVTVLATRALFQKTEDLHEYIRLGGRSRHLLAKICSSENSDHFGLYRWRTGMTVGLITPINDPAYPQYHAWYALCHRRYEESSGNYEIFTVDTDGKKYRGTTFGEVRSGSGDAIFCWFHRKNPKRVHPICQNWLKKVMAWSGGDVDEFYYILGMYYHALTQYSPFERGSATFSMVQVIAHLVAKSETDLEIRLPRAVTLLDCYALSFQAEEFVEKIFIPWCKGAVNVDILPSLKEVDSYGVQLKTN